MKDSWRDEEDNNRGNCGRTAEETRSGGINSRCPLLSLNPQLPFSHSLSFITAFLTLVCLACTNSCHHPAGFECLRSTSHSLLLPLALYLALSLSSHPVVCLLHSFIPLSVFHPPPPLFCSLAHSCLIYIIPCIFSSSSNSPRANFLSSTCLWSVMVPSPHSIVAYFLCTRPCFLLPSKFRPEQDITKTCCMPNMMSWLSWVCLRACVLLPVLVYVAEYPYVHLCIFFVDSNKQSRPDVGLLITN